MSRPTRRLRPDLVVAAALPVVCLAALLVTTPDAGGSGAGERRAPELTALTSASVVCPSALGPGTGAGAFVGVTTLTEADGELQAGLGDDVRAVEVAPSRVSSVEAATGPTPVAPGGPVVVSGTDDLAPALVAGRSSSSPLTATDCRPPSAEQWFAGLGSGATHSSVIELVNPNAGRAVGDVVLWSQSGPLDVPELLGVSVPGGDGVKIDLGALIPRRGELMAQVTTSRGRLAVDVADSVDELGTGLAATDWLAPQAEPSSRNLLLGLTRSAGERTLVLGNPGDDEVRVTVRFVTPDAVFAPAGLEPVAVAPGTTKPVTLTGLLDEAVAQGATGLLLDSTGPVVANLRQLAGGDLSEVSTVSPFGSATAVLVPAGKARLLLADPAGVGLATVVALDASGTELSREEIELVPDTGATVALPEGTALVRVTPERTTVRAALVVTSEQGVAVLPLRELLTDGLVPDVRPALP
ncbi:DUF5719 family protein [Nocardioides sp.]|uniref:DUF5719 family protein n=1 Tax=Nocardioides sp. TaxID=35761 RepID=UPI001A217E5D|nr:DUF5719 family protein [Nocardioides sp.]MBJ7358434.1 hypothetical protein [Nocardioides sp.]